MPCSATTTGASRGPAGGAGSPRGGRFHRHQSCSAETVSLVVARPSSAACARSKRRAACIEWHARWATASCYPEDEHVDAHVRWARHHCKPEGADVNLTDGVRPPGGAASTFADQAMRTP